MKKISKTWLNFWVDAVMFLDMAAIAVIGFIIKYALPPGTGGGHHGRGEGLGEGRLAETLAGLTRHEWGDVHFWIALFLLALLVLHIALHWSWIKCRFKELFQKKDREADADLET